MKIKIGKQLKKMRLKKGLTLKELGKAIHYSPSSLGGIENGNVYPSIPNLQLILEMYQMSLSGFFKTVESPLYTDIS